MAKCGISLFLLSSMIYHSSQVKAAMNAARLCKLRNGVYKTPQFLLSMAKGGTALSSNAEGSSF